MDDHHKLIVAFRVQANACADLGSPFMARLCRLFADRLTDEGVVAHHILAWPGDVSPSGDSVPLRLAGALHALVIQNLAPALKAVYPPHNDGVDDDNLWGATTAALRDHAEFILAWLKSPPQTNEVRRSAALLPGFLTVADQTGLPLVLSEVGASAGLNMHWDQFHYRLGDFEWGDPAATVRQRPDWEGTAPPKAELHVLERACCDLKPVDPSDPEDRLRLRAYLWADQAERLELLDGALDIAARSSIRVEKCDAVEWLARRLAEPSPGAVHVIYHSIAWQYLPKERQAEGAALIAKAGRAASKDAPIAWLRLEADGTAPGAGIRLTLWPTGEDYFLGRGDFHGRWIKWQGLQA